jgi:phosphoribosylpyrophosphate synthetase
MRRRGNISLKLLAQLMVKGGFDHIITVDLHSKESLGFFDCAVDNLRASPFLLQYIQDCVSIALSRNGGRLFDFKFPALFR